MRLSKEFFVIPMVAFAMINGIFSPTLGIVVKAMTLLAPGLLIFSLPILFYFCSLLLATITIIAAGVPAALYERLTGKTETDDISSLIWLAGTALLSLQAIVIGIGLLS